MDNKFNSHFTTIAQNLVYKIKTMTNFCQYIYPQVQNSVFFSPTTRNRKTYSLSSKKSSDIYGISATLKY